MTLEDIKKKYSELIPNVGSIKDPDREVPRDILTQMVRDIDAMRATQDIPLPWTPTEELGEDVVGAADAPKGYCMNFWQFVWFGGLGSYAWQHGSEQQIGGYQGDGSNESLGEWFQDGCEKRCKKEGYWSGWGKKSCQGSIFCRCMGGNMIRPKDKDFDNAPEDLMMEEIKRIKELLK
jgi:hypothetical protein